MQPPQNDLRRAETRWLTAYDEHDWPAVDLLVPRDRHHGHRVCTWSELWSGANGSGSWLIADRNSCSEAYTHAWINIVVNRRPSVTECTESRADLWCVAAPYQLWALSGCMTKEKLQFCTRRPWSLGNVISLRSPAWSSDRDPVKDEERSLWEFEVWRETQYWA